MADFQETKLKYRRGTCFSCRKCMYCGIDLRQEKCNCNLSNVPHKSNRTDAVKYAFTRVFNPNWIKEKVEFVQQRIEHYNYLLSAKEAFNFTLCARCNSILLRLSSKVKKLKASSSSTLDNDIDNSSELETCDLTIASGASESEEKLDWNPNEKEYHEEKYEPNDDESLSGEEVEYEYNYGVFIKFENGTSLPAKWYTAKVSMVDELLSEIHINIETLMGKKPVDPNDYHIAFKSEKAAGAGTQLDREPNNNSDDDIVTDLRNKNSIPKTSNLSSLETSIAKNVLEIHKENHCTIHNRPCLNKDGAKENHVEITFMMLSIWASEINKAIASPTEPPTHPLFAYKYLTKTKVSSQLQSSSIQFNQSNSMQQPNLIQQSDLMQQSNSIQQLNPIQQSD
ncbi:24701_t:CDS:2 [Dentiscutata erythropus]|uniref:24701_t:CDS:1 n=1 Tax=Dentiscutata erythropus TaxID=1348616 RepID=A0A9N9GJB1_9GLOM|nr:24701_t:CDS:2 [Dentiscutata erythropus]